MKVKGKLSGHLGVIVAAVSGIMVIQGVADEKPERPARPEGERGERERGRPSSWDKLPPEKRERIKEVLKQVFESEEVSAARGQMMAATESYKKALREAIGKVDSEIKGDIERILRARLESDFGGRGGRFRGMMIPMERIPNKDRDQMRKLMLEFGELPETKALRKRFSAGGGGERGEEFMKLRVRELALFRKFVAKEAPEMEAFVPEKPLGGAHFGRDGERNRRRDGDNDGVRRRPESK